MSQRQPCRVKICGVRDPAVAGVAAEAGAAFVGLVFVDGSPRRVTVAEARRVIDALPSTVTPVALFAGASADTIRRTVSSLGVRTVQLHGDETPQDAEILAPLRVIKAFSFDDAETARARLQPWRGVDNLTAILFDTPPEGDALPGGGGRAFDWKALARLRGDGGLDGLPSLFLAGGLTAPNVAEAIRIVEPWAVDVSSGVESRRGVKDPQLVERFCRAARDA